MFAAIRALTAFSPAGPDSPSPALAAEVAAFLIAAFAAESE